MGKTYNKTQKYSRTKVDTCGINKKRRFKSKGAANQFIKNLGDNCNAPYMRAYPCQYCGGYHLTSQKFIK